MTNETNKENQSIVGKAIFDFISNVPKSNLAKSDNPERDANNLISTASWKVAAISTSLALPPGPWGMATIIPDLIAIWKIQAQMVADVAALYGKTAVLTPESMLYCCFKHGASHLFRDIIVRLGERILIKRATLRIIQEICAQLGIRITQRLLGRVVSRWIPLIGAVAIGAYAKYDTTEVGKTAIEFFALDIDASETCQNEARAENSESNNSSNGETPFTSDLPSPS